MKLMRKFSLRRQRQLQQPQSNEESDCGMRPSSSWRSMRSAHSSSSMCCDDVHPHFHQQTNHPAPQSLPSLPFDLITRIIDECPVKQQIRMRIVSRAVKQHVEAKLSKVTEMDVRKDDVEKFVGREDWQLLQDQVAVCIQKDTVKFVVDSRWTARDTVTLVGAMAVFRKNLLSVSIDAPIAELIVVSLSVLGLNRWYAFQCYMKALDAFDADVHLECDDIQSSEVYWPQVREITVRTTPQQANHLARVLDYGVRCNLVFNRINILLFRLFVYDSQCTSKIVARHLYNFRCWAGSVGFDDRFEQQFLDSTAPTSPQKTNAAMG
ncbi:hypothetical protein WR25_26980 [Diploscapter pachys]|uniref:F-box domain-containing protein n=1 Tax=Diploscapter pachys TaxID=2018661 RepID=A0A2A2JXF3_9BILA|nr:hypothetical protein WR25_26980 [Diploscapter pachys]